MNKQQPKNNFSISLIWSIVALLLIITIVITTVFIFIISRDFTVGSKKSISWENSSYIATFFGGIIGTLFSSMGFGLIYLSFKSQTDSQKDQKQQFLESQIENRFIELIKLHKENVGELSFVFLNENYEGQKAIDKIVLQFEQCYQEIKIFFCESSPITIYKPESLAKVELVSTLRPLIKPWQLACIDFAYSIIFFGTSEDDLKSLKKLLIQNYIEAFVDEVLDYISLKGREELALNKWNEMQSRGPNKNTIQVTLMQLKTQSPRNTAFLSVVEQNIEALFNIKKLNKYYGGHQYKLGHYFRHLFQTIKYINDNRHLDYEKKYGYIKILRAQLSTIEQYLIFYNSISFMGRPWELLHLGPNMDDENVNGCLFTKYNLIKNTPDMIQADDINLQSFYPEIEYEFEFQEVDRSFYQSKFR